MLSPLDLADPPSRRVSRHRMVVYSGDSNRSAVLYDSLRADSVPFEGVISDGSSIRIDFLAEEPAAATAFNIRFEGDPPPSRRARGQRAVGAAGGVPADPVPVVLGMGGSPNLLWLRQLWGIFSLASVIICAPS